MSYRHMDRFGLGLLLEIKQQSQATKWYADCDIDTVTLNGNKSDISQLKTSSANIFNDHLL